MFVAEDVEEEGAGWGQPPLMGRLWTQTKDWVMIVYSCTTHGHLSMLLLLLLLLLPLLLPLLTYSFRYLGSQISIYYYLL